MLNKYKPSVDNESDLHDISSINVFILKLKEDRGKHKDFTSRVRNATEDQCEDTSFKKGITIE